MMQPVYIRSASAISPQDTFDTEQLPEVLYHNGNRLLYVQDPNYRDYINPVAIRRMSRLLKRGISTGIKALQLAKLEKPDGIITGTGLGSITDMEQFIKDMIAYNEEALNPTYFIQSTYNSINGWLALKTKCTGYNQTYVHRGHSLELSILDAQMLLNETNEQQTYLVGAFDEMTDEHFRIKEKKGYWKKELNNSLELLEHSDTQGSISGEGAAFFTITNIKEDAICRMQGIKMLSNADGNSVEDAINELLSSSNINKEDIDVALCGMNGNKLHQPMYDHVVANIADTTTIAAYKHLCGEYDTSMGFALWMATKMFADQQIHPDAVVKNGSNQSINHILIINHFMDCNASVILLSNNQ